MTLRRSACSGSVPAPVPFRWQPFWADAPNGTAASSIDRRARREDSSLTARKQLAKELHYTGDLSDSASMNIWLHKQVMVKLAENGGKVPEDLKK